VRAKSQHITSSDSGIVVTHHYFNEIVVDKVLMKIEQLHFDGTTCLGSSDMLFLGDLNLTAIRFCVNSYCAFVCGVAEHVDATTDTFPSPKPFLWG
jgi:hypothetical protein